MKKLFLLLSKLFLSVLFTLMMIEIGLRLAPGIIPLDLLVHFHEEPRGVIARQRGLTTKKWDVIQIERDDGGPELTVFRPFTEVSWPVKDDGTISVVVMDDIGFCNPPENSYHLPTIDLITLGDSFTACHAVDPPDIWTAKLSALTGLSAYNLGKGGKGIHEYLQIFKQFGLQKSPRIVIMNIYQGNDIRDAVNYYTYRLSHQDEENENVQAASPWLPVDLVGRYSYAFNLGSSLITYFQATDLGAAYASEEDDLAESSSQAGQDEPNFKYRLVFGDEVIPFNPKNTDIDEVKYARLLRTRGTAHQSVRAVEQVIAEGLTTFVTLSKQYGFVPVVTYTPSAHTAYAAEVEFDGPGLNELMPWYSDYLRNLFAQQGEELGYIFIDLTPSLQAAAQAHGPHDLLYYRYDLHFTRAGHTVVAETIYQKLQELAILAQTD